MLAESPRATPCRAVRVLGATFAASRLVLRNMKRLLPKGEFGRNVLTVLSGTIIAQAIPVAISPILTRLYTPADLGVLALYVSIISIAVVVATGRYELAILLPRRDREAFDILVVAVGLALFVSAIALLLVFVFRAPLVAQFSGSGTVGLWLYALPFSVLMTALYQSLAYWNNRKKHYSRLAASKVGQSGAMCSAQVGAGMANAGSSGLIGGYVLGQLAANGMLLRATWAEARVRLKQCTVARLWAVARRHRIFPTFMIPGHLANVASSQMPVLLLSLLYGPHIAGFYSLAERVLVLPSSIIGSAIGDVYRQQAALAYQATGNCRELFLRTAKKLAVIALIPLIAAVAAGPWLFSVLFGPVWREAGEVTALIGAMVFFQIVSSPLSQTVLLAHMQRLDLLWQIVRLALSVGSIYAGFFLAHDYRVSIVLYVISFSLLYLAHSFLQYRAACGYPSHEPTVDA